MNNNDNNLNNISYFIGFSSPISQKYMLVNNFLANFYESAKDNYNLSFEDFNQIVSFDFNDENEQEKIKLSFEKYFQAFTGITSNRTTVREKTTILPVSIGMLVRYNDPMRNLIYNMLNPNGIDKKDVEIKNMISQFFYSDKLAGYNSIIKLLCKESANPKDISMNKREVKLFVKENALSNLTKEFNLDIRTMTQSENYRHFNFYKKYDYVSTLFSIYSLMYIKYRLSTNITSDDKHIFDNKKIKFLFKGSNDADEKNGDFHRACVKNFKNIRDMFVQQFKEFYRLNMKSISQVMIHQNDEGEYIIDLNDDKSEDLSYFLNSKFGIKQFNPQNIDVDFPTSDNNLRLYSTSQFIKIVMNLQQKSGSSLSKISSTLQKVGKDSGLLFPRNIVVHKYFAFTPESIEFFVRLFISEKRIRFSSLDSFLEWLETKYSIHLRQSKEIDGYLKRINCSIQSQEFNKNVDDLINTMIKANCLIKLSDSGYVVTLPEDKGGTNIL